MDSILSWSKLEIMVSKIHKSLFSYFFEIIISFNANSPFIYCSYIKGYGLTESTGVLSRSNSPEESRHWGSVGRLTAGCEAKIVDADTGDALPPGKQGELWVRGSTIMKGKYPRHTPAHEHEHDHLVFICQVFC